MLSQEPEAQVALDVGGGLQGPGSLQGNLTPFRQSPESRYDRRAIETLDGLLSRPLRPFTRALSLSGKSGFLAGKRRKRERKLTGLLE